MPKPKNKYDQKHLRNLEYYQKQIDEIYKQAVQEAVAIGQSIDNVDTSVPFTFDDYPLTKRRVAQMLNDLNSSVQVCIVNGINSEWTLANNKNNALSDMVFGKNKGKLSQSDYRRYYSTNESARDAFLARKENGLSLSDRVWKYTDMFKNEIEMGLDLGIRGGLPATEMARDLKQYLQHPDMLFRRVRDEYGNLHLSQRAKAFHPGRGVYRSSYMNARRTAATECNMAYRSSDYERWKQQDFVVGIEIHLSNNHTCKGRDGKPHPFEDICDELQGKYPKDFKFTGWHPHCRCYATSILKTDEEMKRDTEKILRGEKPDNESVNRVRDVPQAFKDWLTENDERLQTASSVPYFLADNPKYSGVQPHYGAVGAVTGTKLGRTATKAAFKVYKDLPAPTLTEEVAQNTAQLAQDFGIHTPPRPMPFLKADEGRANTSWGKGDEFEANCQMAVAVHEARLRGLNVTAVGYNTDKESVSFQLGEHFEQIWQHPKTGKPPTLTTLQGDSFDTMLDKVDTATKATGRYHIGINMSGDRGHVITAERLADGSIMYYDAQDGTFLKLEEYAVREVEYFEVLKVDKLLLRRDLFRQIACRL
jgi:hypothetical protein